MLVHKNCCLRHLQVSLIQRCPHFTGGWNREVPLYTEMSSFQVVGNRGVPLYTEVSSFQGVGIEEFHCIQWCPFQGIGIEEFHCIWRCPHFMGTMVSSFQGVGSTVV